MTSLTRTSPLDLGEVRKTQRRVAALLNVPDQSTLCLGRRHRRHLTAGFCYVCGHLDARERGRKGGLNNPYHHFYPKACPHLTPAAPHPTFIGSDGDDDHNADGDFDDDDGVDEGSSDGKEDGALFDTAILRDSCEKDGRLFSLPPVFGKPGDQELKQKHRSKHGRLVPVVSENTFLSTKKRADGDLDDLHLPRLATNERAYLVGGAEGQGKGKRKQKDPRRLHSERLDRRDAARDRAEERGTRSDSALGMGLSQSITDLSREKTDPPPQPITVNIRNQDGEVVHKTLLQNITPGHIPTEAFAEQQGGKSRKKREKKQRRSQSRGGSASPSLSGSISFSRETTLSGWDSPDYFLSRLRSASWCECPEHVAGEGRCPECRRVKDHEKWCVSRNVICQNCGKAFRRKYSQLERKSSFSTFPSQSSGMTTTMMTINNIPTPSSPSRSRHKPSCSPTKNSSDLRRSTAAENGGAIPREATGNNRVRFSGEEGEIVYPQFTAFPDSATEEENEGVTISTREKTESQIPIKSYLPSIDPNIHQKAYNMAIADAKMKAMNQKKKKATTSSQRLQHPNAMYFSYFPLLKTRRPQRLQEDQQEEKEGGGGLVVSPTAPQQMIGLRADLREGKRLKVKKGLKHILGDIKLDDYYPGGRHYPKQTS